MSLQTALHTASLRSAQASRRAVPRVELPATELLLVDGDARLALDPATGLNKYGCRPFPDPDLAAFGSSTSSVISESGFAAAERLRQRLLRAAASGEPHAVIYRRELTRVRCELIRLCGLGELPRVDVVFAASGTDLHRLAAGLVAGESADPITVITTETAETGSGVPAAMGAAAPGIDVVAAAARGADGSMRPAHAVAADIAALVTLAVAQGRRVQLVVADVSKTGLLSPRLDHVLELRERWRGAVEVLVDACQFRLAPQTLRAYLQHGLTVAVTGSKFLTGPAFSGALFVPPSTAQRLRLTRWPAGRGHSLCHEWPRGWAAAQSLHDGANYGLLLRWEAALAELRAFRRLPDAAITRFAIEFAAAVQQRLAGDPRLEALPAPAPERRPVVGPDAWDRVPTIFPFLLRRAGRYLSAGATDVVYQRLRATQCQVGQPVACGARDGQPLRALRLCLSSRLIVDALAGGRQQHVLDDAERVLDTAAMLAAALG